MSIPFQAGALVVTSISKPNPVLTALAQGCQKTGAPFYVLGDRKSPPDFKLAGCDFYGLEHQRALPFAYAQACPEKSYTRKNIGYLLAINHGAKFIVETDDDNFPREEFWAAREPVVVGDAVAGTGWLNAYHYFSDAFIYPRGFPIELARSPDCPTPPRAPALPSHCPIQQGLADENPDVDAIYRMLLPLPFNFRNERALVLNPHLWCPFNSQNTTIFPQAYPLLYLPATCSFRMTDIWRSFVAQRILWTCGWHLSFHSPTVYQERNPHSLLVDFADEISGYLNNAKIAATLDTLTLPAGPENIPANLRRCYQALLELGIIQPRELELLDLWLGDLQAMPRP